KLFLIARMGSKRLPGKHLKRLPNGKLCIEFLIDKLLQNYSPENIVLCTSFETQDDKLVDTVKKINQNIEVFRGSNSNVLNRLYECSLYYNSCDFIRLNADNVMISAELVMAMEYIYHAFNLEYLSNTEPKTLPAGMSVQITSGKFFAKYYQGVQNDDYCKEHVFQKMSDYTDRLMNVNFQPNFSFSLESYALDTERDFKNIGGLKWS
ncbi:MAG: hypothetical protein P8H03_02230, partial [Emcibacteraceae bacterium]|nr:hypothetical protein [Emcibacteraceae bacterium]